MLPTFRAVLEALGKVQAAHLFPQPKTYSGVRALVTKEWQEVDDVAEWINSGGAITGRPTPTLRR